MCPSRSLVTLSNKKVLPLNNKNHSKSQLLTKMNKLKRRVDKAATINIDKVAVAEEAEEAEVAINAIPTTTTTQTIMELVMEETETEATTRKIETTIEILSTTRETQSIKRTPLKIKLMALIKRALKKVQLNRVTIEVAREVEATTETKRADPTTVTARKAVTTTRETITRSLINNTMILKTDKRKTRSSNTESNPMYPRLKTPLPLQRRETRLRKPPRRRRKLP